jgi:hypothetical protein
VYTVEPGPSKVPRQHYNVLETARRAADLDGAGVYGPRGSLLYDAARVLLVILAVGAMIASMIPGIVEAASTAGTWTGAVVPAFGIAPHSGTVRRAFRSICSRLGYDVAARERAVKNTYTLPFDRWTFDTLGRWYERALEDDSPRTTRDHRAYAALRRESRAQLRALNKAGLKTWISDGDPYDNAGEVADAVRNRSGLGIRGTLQHDDLAENHPMNRMARDPRTGIIYEDDLGTLWTYNDAFRAVHDALTHAHIGADAAPFNPVGEYRANCAHALAFSRDAVAALLCEAAGLVAYMHVQGDLTAFPHAQPARAVPPHIVDAFMGAAVSYPGLQQRARLRRGSSPDYGGGSYTVTPEGTLAKAQ